MTLGLREEEDSLPGDRVTCSNECASRSGIARDSDDAEVLNAKTAVASRFFI